MKEKRPPKLVQPELYAQLFAFDFDGATSPRLSFVERLARENGWAIDYAERVVDEYRRFVYLAATGTVHVTPSKQVDAAWHLHLTYTQSYWTRLCGELLQKPLHHEPTRGGHEEHHRFVDQYGATLLRYAKTFGHMAPDDIWPSAEETFGPPPRALWDAELHWVVPKPRLPRVKDKAPRMLPWLLAPLLLVGCAWDPFELVGSYFLLFLIPMIALSLFLGHQLRLWLRLPADDAPAKAKFTDYQAAYLAGGADRVVATAIASLVERGEIESKKKGTTMRPGAVSAVDDRVDAAILRRLPLTHSAEERESLRRDVVEAFPTQVARLQTLGFLLSPGRQALALVASALPVVIVYAVFAFPRLERGLQRHKPVDNLLMTMIVGAIIAAMLIFKGERRLTRRGARWLHTQVTHVRRRKVAVRPSVATKVALLGVTATVATTIPALAGWVPPPSNGGGGSGGSSGDSCGGGGCGGGGCGGCGGS